jgi:2-polyprenyl-3-methyl-5-hydroxy-6-metoxy-1,4-benzoquinol methylase
MMVCRVYGVEASEHRAAESNEMLGGGVVNRTVEQLDEKTFGTQFNLIISNHVLEHCLDPHDFMAAIRRVIKPNGWGEVKKLHCP